MDSKTDKIKRGRNCRRNRLLWGDAHTHSHWSDGLESIRELSGFFKKIEQDFRFQTDHCGIKMPEGTYLRKTNVAAKGHLLIPETFSRYMEECRRFSDDDHVVIPGMELDLDYGNPEMNAKNHYNHIKTLGFSSPAQIPPEGWYRDKNLFKVLMDLKGRGLTRWLAHTNGDSLPWQDLSVDLFDGFDIDYRTYESPMDDPFNRGALKYGFWDKWLTSGKHISISTGSDCHQSDMACFGMRNVVRTDNFSEKAIIKSFQDGKLYISATWHPNVYQDFKLRKDSKNNGKTGFAYWFEIAKDNQRDSARPELKPVNQALFNANYARIRKEDYPVLDFEVENRRVGDIVKVTSSGSVKVIIGIRMHVPIKNIDLIQNGILLNRFMPESREFSKEIFCTVSPGSYIRIQAKGEDASGQREWLISNPVYFSKW